MIVERKTIEFQDRKFAEYIKGKGHFKWRTSLNDTACFIYWLKGANTLYSHNNRINNSSKVALLLKCGTYLSEAIPDANQEVEAIIIHLYPDILKNLFEGGVPPTLNRKSPSTSIPVLQHTDPLIEKWIECVLCYFQNPELIDQDLLSLKIKELVLLLSKSPQRQTLEQLVRHLFSPEEISFKEVIESHIYSNLGLAELAFLTRQSLASFKRNFRKIYQDAPAHYLKKRKLEKAAHLLVATPMRITDIIFECGFSNASHFAKSFRSAYGVSPTAYRLSHSAKLLS